MTKSNMTDVDDPTPQGDEEAQKPEGEPAREKSGSGSEPNRMRILIVVTLLLLILMASLIGVLLPKKKENKNRNNQKQKNITFFEFSDGLFDVKVPVLTPDRFGVYQDVDEASKDFDVMAKFFLNNVVNRNLAVPGYENAGYGNSGSGGGPAATRPVEAAETADGDNKLSGASGSFGDDVQGWETNNQEDFVDRADVAKSDGTYIFAALEDTLVVLHTGKTQEGQKQIVTELKMPEIPFDEPEPCYETTTCNDQGECKTCDCEGYCYSPESVSAIGDVANTSTTSIRSFIVPWWRPKAYIQAMLLGERRLAVVVSGYGYYKQQARRTTPSCINDYLSTQVRLYSTANLETSGELDLIGVQDLHGSFQEAYMIGNIIHFVNMASINTYGYLAYPIERYNEKYSGLDDSAYAASVKKDSVDIVERFTTCLVDEFSLTTGSFPTVAKLGVMVDATQDDVAPGTILPEGFGSSIAQITSINIVDYSLHPDNGAVGDEEPRLQVKQTIQTLDSWWGWSYSANDMIIIAAQGSHWETNLGILQGSTYLFGFLLDGVNTTPFTSGTIPGTLLNEFALDYEDGYIRAATTSRIDIYSPIFGTPVDWIAVWEYTRPVTIVNDATIGQAVPGNDTVVEMVVEEADGGERRLQSTELTEASNNILKMISGCENITDCTDQDAIDQCQSHFDSGCSQVFYAPGSSCNMRCWDDYVDRVEASGCPKPGATCLGEADFDTCLSVTSDTLCGFDVMEGCPLQFLFWCNSHSSLTNSTETPTLSRLVSSCDEIDDCTDQIETCQSLIDEGCEEVFYSSQSCKIYCWDRYAELVAQSGCPTPGDPCLGEDDFFECVQTALDPFCTFNLSTDGVCPYDFDFLCKDEPLQPSYTSPCLRLPKTSNCDHDQQEANCVLLESDGCTDIRVFDDCHFECFNPPKSLTENFVYALFPNQDNKLKVTGKVKIGLDNEEIFAIRFFKRVAYAVTFAQTDPLYSVSFDDPATPVVKGEIKVTGFSRYLHSIDVDDTMLIGLGRAANLEGVVGGLQISMFDATDSATPKLVTSYILEDASSSAEWEEKSFRYVSLKEGEGMGEGVLILPMNEWSEKGTYFDGFQVFGITFNIAAGTGSIRPWYDISHVEDTSMCYICAYLQERSFVVNGEVITLKGRSVRSHDLDDGELTWMVDFAGNGENCCQWWY